MSVPMAKASDTPRKERWRPGRRTDTMQEYAPEVRARMVFAVVAGATIVWLGVRILWTS